MLLNQFHHHLEFDTIKRLVFLVFIKIIVNNKIYIQL
jgi:hypothetical protein